MSRRMRMTIENSITFEEGCDEYLLDCKARNLRDGTIKHYVDSSKQIMKYIGRDTLIKDIDKDIIDDKVVVICCDQIMNDEFLSVCGNSLSGNASLLFC